MSPFHTVHHTHSSCQHGTPKKPCGSGPIYILLEQGHRVVAEASRSKDCCFSEKSQASWNFCLKLIMELLSCPPSCSSKLVRFPSIAICVDNLWYINVSQSGEIVVDAEAYNDTQFFREVKLSYFNETE